MDDIIASLQSLLRQHFHITPTVTTRHDQWFKRVYQSWVKQDKELLLLTPKVSRAEWAPPMLQLSAQLAAHIRDLAAVERQRLDASFPPPHDKLFPDAVLDDPPLLCALDDQQAPALSPRVQRGDWWPVQDAVDLAHAGKALLERAQSAALLRVARMRGVDMQYAADIRRCKRHRRGGGSTDGASGAGWGEVIDEALCVFFFAAILATFPAELLTDKYRYTGWLPYGEILSNPSPPMRFIEALEKRPGLKALRSPEDLWPHMERCLHILATAELLHEACHLPPIDWASRASGAVLYFVGFEAWDRARAGDKYLHCHLNTAKNSRWLAQGLEDALVAEERISSARVKSLRPRDPLRLREPRVELVGGGDSEDEEQDKLAELERAEAAYGSRRSTKYQRRRVAD